MNLKRYKEVLLKPLIDENPITLQILGICSAFSVTTIYPSHWLCV